MEELLNNLLYFLLTNAKDKPSEIETAKKELQKEIHNAIIYWRRWRQVWKWLTDILEKQANVVSKSLLDATIELLEVKEMNIKGTTGFKPEWFSKEMSDFLDKVQELYREISITMGEVNTKAEDKNIESLVDEPDLTRGQKAKSPGDLVPHAPTFFFKDKEWEKVQRQYTDPNLYVMITILLVSALPKRDGDSPPNQGHRVCRVACGL